MNSYMRRQIFFVYDYICQYCNRRHEESNLEVDHIHPKSLGGEDRLSNYTVACFHCNRKKKDSVLPESYKALLLAVAERKASVIKKRLAANRGQSRCNKRLESPESDILPTIKVSYSDPTFGPLGWLYTNPRKVMRLERIELSYPSPRSSLQPKMLSFLLAQLGPVGDQQKVQVKLPTALLVKQEEVDEVLDWSFQMRVSVEGGSCGIFSQASLGGSEGLGFDELTLSSRLNVSELGAVSRMMGVIYGEAIHGCG